MAVPPNPDSLTKLSQILVLGLRKEVYAYSPQQTWARHTLSLPCLAFARLCLEPPACPACGPDAVSHTFRSTRSNEVLHIRQGVQHSNICSSSSTQLSWVWLHAWASCQRCQIQQLELEVTRGRRLYISKKEMVGLGVQSLKAHQHHWAGVRKETHAIQNKLCWSHTKMLSSPF